jgi:hypothetical protein
VVEDIHPGGARTIGQISEHGQGRTEQALAATEDEHAEPGIRAPEIGQQHDVYGANYVYQMLIREPLSNSYQALERNATKRGLNLLGIVGGINGSRYNDFNFATNRIVIR